MATVCAEAVVDAPAEQVWAAVADVGQVHRRLPLTYHHASFQVFDEAGRGRLVWLTDVLPHAMAGAVRARVERGIVEMKQVIEAAADRLR